MVGNFKKGEWFLALFNLLYILGFGGYYISIKNFEFLWYVAVLVFFFLLVVLTLKKSKFDYTILWGLSLWGFLHMAGGGVPVGDGVLYGYQLLSLVDNGGDFFILKFDQLVHAFGFGVATLFIYHLLKPYLNEKTNWGAVYAILIAAGSGLGALNEIVEFVAVVSFPETGVGGYANTALDLVFNIIGATLAVIFIHVRRLKTARGN
ncbi:MAG: DUF2238 domain-containing protein [Candidatus Pacebacteria bacterium]|jgi:putative membrane protein|nr:DUF2238 domain-containing protein [Candidatus Paceibacterota bacterium]MDP6659501.1 DUF2238 domain-containing protein [Candidatus Paceibacterota bacterium]|tara:strand:- start:46292 stop:46909 length:618 start_codon:yes stop_codon:yes gene_type:complete